MAEYYKFQPFNVKPRVFIISDISNEPDDAESLVRYLLYANELETRGLVACTSTHIRNKTCPEDMEAIVRGYAQVADNLNVHVHPDSPFPPAQTLLAMIRSGPAMYGKAALEPSVPLSGGTVLLIDEIDKSLDPLWVLCWGGTNVLAQALHHVHKSRSPEDCQIFRSKIRVYAISDQDDTGLWIRTTFPDIFYICSIHGWSQYSHATWTGISSEADKGGSDSSKITRAWLRENIQIGPFGQCYPDHKFLIEGDTPTFLYLIQNGLGSPEHPEWGSWGGRYDLIDPGMAAKHWSDTVDTVEGKDGNWYTSNYATVWRWRDAFQNDFAARMQWTMTKDVSRANHAPLVCVNGNGYSPDSLVLEVEAGQKVVLDASRSYDPDGDVLSFHWFLYKEVSITTGLIAMPQQIPHIQMDNVDPVVPDRKVEISLPPPELCAIEPLSGNPVEKGQVFHFILQVKDNGTPCLTTYKRVIIQTTNSQLKGKRGFAVDTTAEWLELEHRG
ncbi:hypothetical protein QWA68_015089 [Fusarium oxysporum]|nr:hypothetical protein QWA68_015089 [Fusarium oxysporum]